MSSGPIRNAPLTDASGTGASGTGAPGSRASGADARPAGPPMLHGRVALVTGGGTGIGAAVALALAEAGADVTITGRTEATLAEAAGAHPRISTAVCDVTDARITSETIGRLAPDIVVANAGMALSVPFHRMEPEQLRELLEVNVVGVHNTFRAALAALAAPDGDAPGRGGDGEAAAARFVAIASTAALRGYPYVSGYAAAKHAVLGLVRSLALELAASGITVNAICPGYTETPMLRRSVENIMSRTGRDRVSAEAPLLAGNPQGRFVQPFEVASTVLWLASAGAAAVTGQAISVSGGETS